MIAILIFGLIGLAYGGPVCSDELINSVNSANTTWKAGHNFAKDVPLSYLRKLLGAKKSPINFQIHVKNHDDIDNDTIPDEFDARKRWPNCPSISNIRDQGACGTCWAVATASAFSDRVCIASNGKFKKPLSAHELTTCCEYCCEGYDGGFAEMAWKYLKENGIVTGGDYDSHVGCQPYQCLPNKHDNHTPKCSRSCTNPLFKGNFKADHHKIKTFHRIRSQVEDIQKEILNNGPVVVGYKVYKDFFCYKSGIYQHTQGKELGRHAVKLIGWGTENYVPYWLISNSWNATWGDNGLFKIIRGKNECGIEDEVTAGEV